MHNTQALLGRMQLCPWRIYDAHCLGQIMKLACGQRDRHRPDLSCSSHIRYTKVGVVSIRYDVPTRIVLVVVAVEGLDAAYIAAELDADAVVPILHVLQRDAYVRIVVQLLVHSTLLDGLKATLLLELSARAATRCTPILALHNVSLSVAHIAAALHAHKLTASTSLVRSHSQIHRPRS